jgi:hypothetical protein
MTTYVLSFRSASNRQTTSETEAARGRWFAEITPSIADMGNRVGDALSGYILVNADSLAAAKAIAEGCPGIADGGVVEVGEIVPS